MKSSPHSTGERDSQSMDTMRLWSLGAILEAAYMGGEEKGFKQKALP